MEILEYGDKTKRKIILIHGFESPYQIWEPYIEHYKNDFHVIVPILPGHNPRVEEEFVSFEACAKELEDFYIKKYGKDVYAVYGMSMGGVLASHIWSNQRLRIEKLNDLFKRKRALRGCVACAGEMDRADYEA